MKISLALKFLAVLIFCLIVVGGLVRNLGAGLSCPDWPLCQGHIIPEFDLRVFAEFFHRLFAATVSILTLVIAGIIFWKADLRLKLAKPMGWALVFLLSQVILGGLTVLKLLQSEIVTLHLATGTLFFLTVIYTALKSRREKLTPQPSTSQKLTGLFKVAALSLFAVYFQIILGGVVSSHYAGLACPDFPTCLGQWWPDLVGNVGIQWIHRLGATAVFLIILYFSLRLLRTGVLKGYASLIILALITQVGLGIANVVFRLPVPLSVAHLAVAECLIALVLMTTYEIYHFQLR
jgi:cytochrome c oxidase assembly protein subunit 15